jgi:hypothetical protein
VAGDGGAGATGTGGGGDGGEAGGSAAGGAPGGGGGAGGSPGCRTCAEALARGPGGPRDAFCPMSADLYSAVDGCACPQNGCPVDCVDNFCASEPASQACVACLEMACKAIIDACQADDGG